MAIGFTGPRAQSYSLLYNDKGTEKSIYLQTRMVQLQPLLKNTNILSLIRNSSGVGTNDPSSNTRFYFNIKDEGDLSVVRDENGMVVDPRTIKANKMQVIAKQVAPIDRVIKFGGFKKDLDINGLENLVSIKMSDYIYQKRMKDQNTVFQKALLEAADFQKVNLDGLTTFDEGAHYITNKKFGSTDANAAYDHLCEAIDNFTRLGQENASQDVNKTIPHCYGVPLTDMIILASNQFTTILKKVPGLFSSEAGNEMFKQYGLSMVEGVPYYATSQLPRGINFIILTTGIHGAICYEECGSIMSEKIDGKTESVMNFQCKMVDDPEYSGAFRIDFTDTIKMDIIFPELIFVSSQEKALPTKSKSVKDKLIDEDVSKSEADMVIAGYSSRLKTANEDIAALNDAIEKIKASNDKNAKKQLNKKYELLKTAKNNKDNIEKAIKLWKEKSAKYAN